MHVIYLLLVYSSVSCLPACRWVVTHSRSIAGESRSHGHGRCPLVQVQPRFACHAGRREDQEALSLSLSPCAALPLVKSPPACVAMATNGGATGSFPRLVRWSQPRCLPGAPARARARESPVCQRAPWCAPVPIHLYCSTRWIGG